MPEKRVEPRIGRDHQDGIPADRMDEPVPEPGQVERSGTVRRVEAIGRHPGEQRTPATTVPPSERDARATQIRPLAQRDQRGAVRREHRRSERVREREGGRDDGVGNPAPAAAPLERDDEEERRQHDSEQPERVRTRLARGLDHAGVEREHEPGDEAPEPPEQHRAEHDHQPGRDRDCHRRTATPAPARRYRPSRAA